jgi:hypothetical protein
MLKLKLCKRNNIMLKKPELVTLFIFLLISFSIVKADVGVGITYTSEELFLADEFKENCINYKIYNPFDTGVTAIISVDGEIKPLVTRIEPNNFFLPAFNGSDKDIPGKLANNQPIKVCFKAKVFRWPPFYPLNLNGVIIAGAARGNVAGTGSSTVSSVQAPLILRVGSMKSFYNFVIVSVIIIVVLIILVMKAKNKIPKREKKYCSKCGKKFSAKNRFCPNCGGELGPA